MKFHSFKEDNTAVFHSEVTEIVDVADWHLQCKVKFSNWNEMSKNEYSLVKNGHGISVKIQGMEAERIYSFRLLILEKNDSVTKLFIDDFINGTSIFYICARKYYFPCLYLLVRR